MDLVGRGVLQPTVQQVADLERAGLDVVWVAEAYTFDAISQMGYLAAKTERIRIGLGIRQVIPGYNHPSRSAETVAMLDLISGGRADFGIGEGATRLELRGYGINARRKQALSLEAAEQIANMMVMTPYPGYEGEGFSMPCRNVIPKPRQKPHPPMWMACTNRATIEVAARNGLGVLAFSFLDPQSAAHWAEVS